MLGFLTFLWEWGEQWKRATKSSLGYRREEVERAAGLAARGEAKETEERRVDVVAVDRLLPASVAYAVVLRRRGRDVNEGLEREKVVWGRNQDSAR